MSLLDAACIKTDDGTIHVAPNGVISLPGLLTPDIPATDVVDIAIEDGKEASKRVTAARVAAADPTPKRWWQKTTGDLINERRARKGKAPINFNAA